MQQPKYKKLKNHRFFLAMCAVPAVMLLIVCLTAAFCGGDKNAVTADVSASGILISETPETEMEPTVESVSEPELISLGEFTVTAYCPCVICCGEWSKEHPSRVGTDYVQMTASGTIPQEGRTIGVDPNVIPYGTIVVIFGHEYIAEDSGAALNGNTIDIYFDSHDEALDFGRQTTEVFVKNIKED